MSYYGVLALLNDNLADSVKFRLQNFLKVGCISMQINRSELQKVRVKLSRDALTIQKDGRGSSSPTSLQVNQLEVRSFILILPFSLHISVSKMSL